MIDLRETIEDALVEALEQGATPPKEFTIRLPWDALYDAEFRVIRCAGHVVRLAGEDLEPPTQRVH